MPAAVHASPDGGVPGLGMLKQDRDTQLVLGGRTLWLWLTQAWTPLLLRPPTAGCRVVLQSQSSSYIQASSAHK